MKVERTSNIFVINGLLMTFVFVTSRILTLPYYWYTVYQVYGTHDQLVLGGGYYVMVWACFALDILNLIWARRMLLGAHKVIKSLDTNSNVVRDEVILSEGKEKSS